MTVPDELRALLDQVRAESGPLVVLTGAGISAESGVPTFRGPEGYWTIGSEDYRPEQLATMATFRRMPEDVWSWYLYRRSVCQAAEPNAAHRALAELEHAVGDGLRLVTQNVDGLHLRAGNTLDRTFQIHGNLDFVRCASDCTAEIFAFPPDIDESWERGRSIDGDEAQALRCAHCGGWLRPHVLWFDECYDEDRYRFDSSLQAADDARLLLVVGTSGATNLPAQMCERVFRRGGPMVVVNQDPSPFTEMAQASPSGYFARGTAGEWVVLLAQYWSELC